MRNHYHQKAQGSFVRWAEWQHRQQHKKQAMSREYTLMTIMVICIITGILIVLKNFGIQL